MAILAVAPVVSLVVLRSPRWYPVFDLAMIEANVRDVAGAHPPLLGLTGRLGTFAEPGHHPGPLGFYALWPVYALAGGSSWALRLSSVVLTVTGVASAGWIAARRGGRRLVVGVGAAVAVLLAGYPATVPVEPWNPFQPVFWWPVVLLGVWSVLEDDLAVLPLTVFAASLCAQIHISYVGLVGGLGLLTVAVLAVRTFRRRADRAARTRLAGWTLGSAALGLLLWLPPIGQQLFGAEPNLSIIVRDFADPDLPPLGLRVGTEALLARMDPWKLAAGRTYDLFGGSWLPGAALVIAWAASAVLARGLRDRRIVRLHTVLGVTLAAGVLSARSIHGMPYPYLFLWAWASAVLMILASAWTLSSWWRSSGGDRGRAVLGRVGPAAAAALVLFAFTGVAVYRGARIHPAASDSSRALGRVASPAIESLERSAVPGLGRDGRYLVTWRDPMSIEGQGWGLANEMLRAGLDVGLPPVYARNLAGDRARTPSEATAVVHLSVGPDIETWRRCPAARELAHHDPRTRAERAETRRLTARAQARLREVGAGALAPGVESGIMKVGLDPRVPDDVRRDLVRIIGHGWPLAVFVAPPDVRCPPGPGPVASDR